MKNLNSVEHQFLKLFQLLTGMNQKFRHKNICLNIFLIILYIIEI